ncbi:MAG: HD domain-containing protein [Desulfobacterales bacterium]|nr:MAG: HD domain-containing protein [Desulfobacterales bacterium]
MENKAQKLNSPKAKQDLKLSFRKLAAAQDKLSPAGRPAVKTSHSPNNNHNRKDLYDKASIYLNQLLSAVKSRKSFALEPGFRILQKMAEGTHPRDELFIMAIHLDDRFKYVIHHSINVAIYALKMADDLGFDPKRKLELGMAALLHDIGMAVIPDKILYKQQELSKQEINILRERPNYSCKILRSFGTGIAYLAESAAQVYERIDGSGYPRGLKGDEIHEYAQIIGLLDMYEALIHSRPQRDKLTHFTAVKEVINTCKHRFQRKHLKSLLSIFTVFPIHSYVRLNSNAIGKVIETYADQPMRPKLQIIYDSQRRRVLTERIVVLPENPLLNIVDSVSESEIQELTK